MLEFGAGLAGVVLVTVNPVSGPRTGICAQAIPLGRRVRRHLPSAAIRCWNGTRGCPALPRTSEIICFDDWAAFIATGHDKRIAFRGQPDDPVMIQYTPAPPAFRKARCCSPRPRQQWRRYVERMGSIRRRIHHDHAAVSTPAAASAACSVRYPRPRRRCAGSIRTPVVLELFADIAAMRWSAYRPCWWRCSNIPLSHRPIFHRSRRSVPAVDRAGRARHIVRAKAGGAVHDRVRTDGMLAGSGPDHDERYIADKAGTIVCTAES